jgi:ornithine cyclodeaminase
MRVISESDARALVSVEDAIAAVRACFVAMAQAQARNYNVVREPVGLQDAVFGVKTGCSHDGPVLGLKAGGYWPHNLARGLTNHQSATLLFDPDTGRAAALVSANYLTGVRTGAASAIATQCLAREDSTVLGLLGTGGQALYQLRATLAVRPIRRVHAWGRSADKVAAFGREVEKLGVEFIAGDPESVVRNADVLVTVTPAREALVQAAWVRPGTHVNAMGADTRGKQELDAALLARASIFVDEAAQAVTIGECQHAHAAGLLREQDLQPLGEVLAGLRAGRTSPDQVTVFDGTGVALQDLVVADLAWRLARERGVGSVVDY